MVEILRIIITICGVTANLGLFLQSYKIIKNKSSKNVSVYMYIINLISAIVWIYYAYTISEYSIVIINTVAIIGCTLVIIPYFIFKKDRGVVNE